ncbi:MULTISPECIES: Uma2 family endonuclease [Cyanophyceae]|uniref:Uma2 family endonuclease n=1 Tax=Cyanophyceae TaxID=3028117 RepID=UPI0016850B01|nr:MULTISPECIES: Uma2 family endonuclease [Cyanophyceae]MBD1919009.1 Uma2 family endonuclease [Phormidium sp. FACHB-77]MBD2031971.1 Uma2 family endonuclease [Phormidium sp. FACHB-322]MBD2053934.1 Uma2 family endonuclease [Leptolyngbya sp. FACHB-60]
MVQTRPRFYSFEEYLAYDDGTEHFYELFNGELIEVPPESGQNVQIANRLLLTFALLLGIDRVRGHGLELEVRGEPKNRYPDLTVIQPEHIQLLAKRNTIRLTLPPPALVVEVVSPGELQWERDYVAKRAQYEDLGISEYWIINPQDRTVLLLAQQGQGFAPIGTFAGEQRIESAQFTDRTLTAAQLFAAELPA